ncbi:MAG: hypothetical protein JST38_21615 [Bacteroidetes bacterium]|nr:hypothetical protein [Bacteroidota bacterium]MBS1943470.1 hypothetical protein [Bacteroidota bacterium]
MEDSREQLYAGLGYLFYSIAASDGHVASAEAAKLKRLVRDHWAPLERRQDDAGTDLAYYIEIGFDHANDNRLSPDTAFQRFKEAHARNKAVFDGSTQHLVTRTAKAVADAFGGQSQQERRILEQMKEVFL